jgi:sterol desaturase/sphingolipid hydroxylase (fatty acid hydroxylase superfamily)
MALLPRIAAQTLWPLLVGAFGYTVYRVLAAGGGGGALGVTAAAIVVVLMAVERLLPLHADADALGDPQLWNDMGHGALSNEVGNRIAEQVFLTAAASLAAGVAQGFGILLWPTHWSFATQVVLLVVIADGLEYWRHRLMHTVSWLWPIHALHHSVDRLHALKGGRNTFVDMALRGATVFAPLVLVGVPRDVLLWYPAVIIALGPISHANIAFRLPSFIHRLVVTTAEHRLHHAVAREFAHCNFAPVMPFWDILFGTFEHPDAHAVPAVGIEGDPIPAGFVTQFLTPFVWWRLRPTERRAASAAG